MMIDTQASPAVTCKDLSVSFKGRNGTIRALESLSFEVAPGEVTCLVGPSGSGKTTALRVVAGLQRPTEGEVTVNGQPISGPPDNLGMMFQQPVLLDWLTAEDNVALPLRAQGVDKRTARESAAQLMEDMALQDFHLARPYELSGGMQQRVALARALICKPSLLLMDEPFSALDAMTRDVLADYVQEILAREQVATILVTHSIQEAVIFGDRVLVLSAHPGRLVADVPVNVAHPRTIADRALPEFVEAMTEVTNSLDDVFGTHGKAA